MIILETKNINKNNLRFSFSKKIQYLNKLLKLVKFLLIQVGKVISTMKMLTISIFHKMLNNLSMLRKVNFKIKL